MPELPEVETVRRSLTPHMVGRGIAAVAIARADILRNAPARARRAALGQGRQVVDVLRHGKQLAIALQDGPAVHVHLGMTGQLFVLAPGQEPPRRDHIHVRWTLDSGWKVVFRDPRRFGGVWTFPSLEALRRERWAELGPDALTIRGPDLHAAIGGSRRAVKACLLDQRLLAGVGNIYADESLFAAGIHPERPASLLSPADSVRLAGCVRRVLRDAVAARGSSLRDFLDAELRRGEQQTRFRVYGRAGQLCRVCGSTLEPALVGGRSTTFCPRCQPLHSP